MTALTIMDEAFLFSELTELSYSEDFVFSCFFKTEHLTQTCGLVIRSVQKDDCSDAYLLLLDPANEKLKFLRRKAGESFCLSERPFVSQVKDGYQLKILAFGSWISISVNDTLIYSSGDYYLFPMGGQDTCILGGYFGLVYPKEKPAVENLTLAPLGDDFHPALLDITVVPLRGECEEKAQFFEETPTYIQYVKNEVSKIHLCVNKKCANAQLSIIGPEGDTYQEQDELPLSIGANRFTLISEVKNEAGLTAALTYRVDVHRRRPEAEYYTEPYRDRFHYSLKDGWANDPNGMVYYKGTWHLFHQFYEGLSWGPMHWAHATSGDLLHWKQEPMAFYPDAHGMMFSGCAVADEGNTSGLFSGPEGGLVALITADGNGQRIEVAYSEDEGRTWKKHPKIAVDWTRDPLHVMDFRDPKVFRWDNRWFMIIAGGPVRIYSSENLLDWTCEFTWPQLHTECPDLYPVYADDGALKWVLSRGGHYYLVGDFDQVDGHYTFLPDPYYQNKAVIMNFGRDAYAAMTFYTQDFGTKEAPNIPTIYAINWLNRWFDYGNLIGERVGQPFNGTFTLALASGLVKKDGRYVLTQTPAKAYEALREPAVIDLKDTSVAEADNQLRGFFGDCYEIVATIQAKEARSEFGFWIRGRSMKVSYEPTLSVLTMDRSHAGFQISERFGSPDKYKVSLNEDGSLDLRIYVDRASVEVIAASGRAVGTEQFFPAEKDKGLMIFGDETLKIDLKVYPIKNIWA